MEQIFKATWANNGDKVSLSMPISKVDVEKRTVSGWASMDNVDRQRDLVTALASKNAFAEFRGNIREQHDVNKAVGRMVDFREDTFYNQKEDKFYQGIYVTVYVSKGAQDTWEKVLDGTLSGFSIGGVMVSYENDVDKDGNPYRKVTGYSLTELSLVDSPANQLANVVSFEKLADSDKVVVKGEAANVSLENIFVCNTCLDSGAGVHKSEDDEANCPICGTEMVNIGFVESGDSDQKATVAKMVDSYVNESKGGVTTVPEEVNNEVEETEVENTEVENDENNEEVPSDESGVEETESTEETDEAPEVEEVEDPLDRAVAELRALTDEIAQSNAKSQEKNKELVKALEDLDAKFEERLVKVDQQVKDLQGRQEEFSKKFEGIEESVGEVQKGLVSLDGSTALRKSSDPDQSVEEENSAVSDKWKGSFLGLNNI